MRYTSLLFAILALSVTGCAHKPAAQRRPTGKHIAAHGGSLNAIVTCENGHAEVKIEGAVMHLWFVGGGSDTAQAVRVPDKSIAISVNAGGVAKTLVLHPTPLALAGESIGDCSCFEGQAAWLTGLTKFTANGRVTFRGTQAPLRIEYPGGYDPD